jgi:protein TonB
MLAGAFRQQPFIVENGMLDPMQNIRPFPRQRMAIVVCVLLLHVLALWALQTGLLQRVLVLAEEIVVPVEFITPEIPPLLKPPPILPKPPPSVKNPVAAPTPSPAPPTVPAPAPVPLAIADPTPSATAPVGVTHATAAVAPLVVAPSAPTLAAKVELPSSDADYLHNPKPKYPGLSIARNEQGTVRLAVLVGVDGKPKDVKIKTSSGFERLDRAARDAVLGWTFVPGKRAGVPDEMWYDLPMPFKLTE